MSEVLQTNIFFFITSVAVVAVTILIGIAIFYVVAILKNVKEISDRAKKASEVLGQDFSDLREVIKKEGAKIRNVFDFFVTRFTRKKRRAPRKKDEEEH